MATKKLVYKVTANNEIMPQTFDNLNDAAFFLIWLRNIENGEITYSVIDPDGYIVDSRNITIALRTVHDNAKHTLKVIDQYFGENYFIG